MTLGDLLAALDAAVNRLAHAPDGEVIRALSDASNAPPVEIAGVSIPAGAMMPREIMAAEKVHVTLPLEFKGLDVTITDGRRPGPVIDVEWRSVLAMEAMARVRTDLEGAL